MNVYHRSLIGLLILLAGCQQPPASGLPTVHMPVGSKSFELEVAATEKAREHGLMERDELPADHGMIFVFDDEAPRSFWMHHTRFPLDIIFTDAAGKVVSVSTMEAYDEKSTPCDAPARYAIELPTGSVAAAGVKVGDKLSIPSAAKTPGS